MTSPFETFLVFGFPLLASAAAALYAWRPGTRSIAASVILLVATLAWQAVDGFGGLGSILLFIALPLGGFLYLARLRAFRLYPFLLVVVGPCMYWGTFFGGLVILTGAGVLR